MTRYLNGERAGDTAAERALYEALRTLAGAARRGDRAGQALQTTLIVHEAWLKLGKREWASRGEFFAAAARAMRQILVDEARRQRVRHRERHGVSPSQVVAPGEAKALDVLALDEALTQLAAHDARAASVVTLRFFGGLEMAEVGETLGVSQRTAERDWAHARAWLLARLRGGGDDGLG